MEAGELLWIQCQRNSEVKIFYILYFHGSYYSLTFTLVEAWENNVNIIRCDQSMGAKGSSQIIRPDSVVYVY